LREKYELQQHRPSYREICDLCPVIGTWDDHDFGANDAGKNYPNRVESQQAFLDFLREPATSKRRQHEGIYTYRDFGPAEQRIRFILLDTRYFRDDIGSDGDILGETQWKWLEGALATSKAQINVLVSSFQVVPEDHRFEKWSNFGKARKRLFDLLAAPKSAPVIILSGDRHLAEISQLPTETVGYPLTEITSSALTQSSGGNPKEINRHRIGENYGQNNFGTLSVDWTRTPPIVTAAVNNLDGAPVRAITVNAPTKPTPPAP
jgi:alkaline phosphatase D